MDSPRRGTESALKEFRHSVTLDPVNDPQIQKIAKFFYWLNGQPTTGDGKRPQGILP